MLAWYENKASKELLLVNILAILLIIVITFFPSNVLRVTLGLPLMLFFPGYTSIAVLFPKKSALDGIERLALSFGLSIAVVPLTGLVLNYTPWGIRLYPILISLTIFLIITSVIPWYWRHKLAEAERFAISFNLSLPLWRGQNTADKVLSIVLIAAILGAIGTVGYVIATPKIGEKFTEFYVLGLEGKAMDYPREMAVGEEPRVIVGIVNREHETVSYQVEMKMDGVKNNRVELLVLGQDEKWEKEVSFTPNRIGDKQQVEFLLYRRGQTEVYQETYL